MKKHSNITGLKPWKPGQSGNPLGRPQGTRSKFSEAAMANLLDDWTKHGPGVLAKVRAEVPVKARPRHGHRGGYDTTHARRLLGNLRDLQSRHIEHRNRLLRGMK